MPKYDELGDAFKDEQRRKACSFYDELFHDKWSSIILSALLHKAKGFNELLADFYISPSNLSKVLKLMEQYRLIAREVIPTKPVSVRYSLTECGKDFVCTVLAAQGDFILKWFAKEDYMASQYLESRVRREPAPENI